VQVLAALPGVDPGQVETTIDQGYLIIAGQRILPEALRHAVVHRLELPQGRFQRRIPLPPGKYESVQLSIANGCLQISLQKA
jgi:HSP20 family molecular chaperone IbpA